MDTLIGKLLLQHKKKHARRLVRRVHLKQDKRWRRALTALQDQRQRLAGLAQILGVIRGHWHIFLKYIFLGGIVENGLMLANIRLEYEKTALFEVLWSFIDEIFYEAETVI